MSHRRGPDLRHCEHEHAAAACQRKKFDAVNDSLVADAHANTPKIKAINAIGRVPMKAKLLTESNNDLMLVYCRCSTPPLAKSAWT